MEKFIVKEHDVVMLKDGRRGTIVYIYNDNFFEIEYKRVNKMTEDKKKYVCPECGCEQTYDEMI